MSCNQNCLWLWSLLVLCYILMTGTSCFIHIKSAQREINYCQIHKNGIWIFKSAGLQENWIPPHSFNRNLHVTHPLKLRVYTVPLPSGFEQSLRYTRDLKIRGRRGQRKRRWKSEFAFFQSSSRLRQVTNFEPSLSWLRRWLLTAKKCTKIVRRDCTAVAEPDLEITGGGVGGSKEFFFGPSSLNLFGL